MKDFCMAHPYIVAFIIYMVLCLVGQLKNGKSLYL